MRTVSVTLAGVDYSLTATFAASVEISKRVRDPLEIMRFAAMEQVFADRGIPYNPPWKFTVANIPILLHIGFEATEKGYKSLEQVPELCFEAGFLESQVAAVEYLTAIVGPTGEETLPATSSGDEGKK